jgi:hypothetical protein
MDWKRLVQFTLLGRGDLEQYATLLVRVSLGLFFTISEANKLFVAGRTQTMYETGVCYAGQIMQVSSWRYQSRASVAQQKRDRSWNLQTRPGFHVVASWPWLGFPQKLQCLPSARSSQIQVRPPRRLT